MNPTGGQSHFFLKIAQPDNRITENSRITLTDFLEVLIGYVGKGKKVEPRTKNKEPRIKNQEPRIKNQESRIKSQESRIKSQE